MKRWSLQVKITLLVGLVLAAACLGLTVNSIYSARGYYGILDDGAGTGVFPEKGEAVIPDVRDETVEMQPDSLYSMASRQFSIQSVLVMAGVILVSVVLTYWLTGRLLAPLKNLTRSISAVDQGKLHQRVVLPGAEGEVLQLTDSFNHMMERLEDSFEIQKNFAANAAHELKTPLAVLKTSLQVLEMEEEPSLEDYREFTCAAKSGIGRLTGTVDALLSLTESEAEKTGEKIDLSAVLEQIDTELRPQAEKNGIRMSLSGASAFVWGDPVLFYRAFFNLVENAVKYTAAGAKAPTPEGHYNTGCPEGYTAAGAKAPTPEGGRVDIAISRVDGRPQITIADTGIGMSKEALSHVFEPFYRADSSRSQRIPGSGLGLSVVRTILERYNGSIFIESEEGRGTVVTVIFEQKVE